MLNYETADKMSDYFKPVFNIQIVILIHLAKNLACGGNIIVPRLI